MPMIEYYAEVNKQTQEKTLLCFPGSSRPIPRPFYRKEEEENGVGTLEKLLKKGAREIRRINLDTTLRAAKYIDASGNLVDANYSDNERKGRTPSQEAASVRHDKGELVIVSRDFVKEHVERLAARAANASVTPAAAAVASAASSASAGAAAERDVKKELEIKTANDKLNVTKPAAAAAANASSPSVQVQVVVQALSANENAASHPAAAGVHFKLNTGGLSTDGLVEIKPTENALVTGSPLQPKK